MATLYSSTKKPISLYKDRRYTGDINQRHQKLQSSTTLYVGNLSFYTTEEQVFDLFTKVGEIKRIIMGLDRIKKTPCGFCFVEYFTRRDAQHSVNFLSGTKLDERTIRVDYDVGYETGRQYGRGRSGGQVRDEHRNDYDPGRGGYGKIAQTGMNGMQLWATPVAPRGDTFHQRGGRRARGRARGAGPGRWRGRGGAPGSAPGVVGMKRARETEFPREDGVKRQRGADEGREPVRNARFDRGKRDDE